MAEPTLAAAVLWLAYGNFRYAFESGRQWRRNILGLIAVLVVVNGSVAAVYHRVWELAMPFEGPHGPARLPVGKYSFFDGYGSSTLAVLLPDGRFWQERIDPRTGRPSAGGNNFASGSNWVAASSNWRATLGIRSDGTLWVSEKPEQPLSEGGPSPFVQFGLETNWQSVACSAGSLVILLKRDGTLWRLENKSPASKTYEGLRALAPHRLGVKSDWARILQGDPWIYAWKRDGTAWSLSDVEFKGSGPLSDRKLDSVTMAQLEPDLDHIQFQSLNVRPNFSGIQVGLRDDGTLWYWDWFPQAVRQIGHDSNWAAATFGYSQLVALKTDGSIWEWKFNPWEWNFDPTLRTMDQKLQGAPVRMVTHDDWVGLGSWLGDTVTLAADGTLWRCPRSDVWPWFRVNESSLWLAPSRRPAKIENILGAK
jgi:hypothetical protein